MRSQINASFTSKNVISLIISLLLVTGCFAEIIVTPAATKMDISADKAANAMRPDFTLMHDILLAETTASDFANTAGTSKSFILTAPGGWIFNTVAGNISVNSLRDFKAVSMIVKEKNIIISFIIRSTTSIDILTISGIEIKATDGAKIPCLGQIHISAINAGSAKLPGVKMTRSTDGQGATNFGIMSQTTGGVQGLSFANNPDSSIAGVAFDNQPVIVTLDQFGNVSNNGLPEVQNVKIVLSAGTGNLSGTAILNIGTAGGNGMVSFSDLKVNTAGAKKLMAKSNSLTFAVTNEFVVANENTASENSTDDDSSSVEIDPDLVCYNAASNIAVPVV